MPEERGAAGVRGALGTRLRDAMFGLSGDFPEVVEIDLARILPNPHQPRRTVEPEALAELARSIERHGLLQPIVVRGLDDRSGRYMLVAGQRRLRAHQELGRATIFAIVTRGDADELALIENLQREDLSPLDEAEAMARLMASHRYTQEQLGRILGRRQSTISETVSLVGLPERIKADYRASDTPVAKAVLVELARVRDPDWQLELWAELRTGGTLRQARARKARRPPPAATPVAEAAARAIVQGRNFVRALEQLPGRELGEPAQREALLLLRDRIDALIGGRARDPEPPAGGR